MHCLPSAEGQANRMGSSHGFFLQPTLSCPVWQVHVYFAEPTEAPCVTLGLMTGRGAAVSVADVGLSGKTEADGLAGHTLAPWANPPI